MADTYTAPNCMLMPEMSSQVPSAEALLTDLVGIRSVNPALPGARPDDGEHDTGAYVAQVLHRHGVQVTLQEVVPGRYNVIGHAPRGDLADDKVVLLCAHMDTYPASQAGEAEYQPIIEDGMLFGRGSADAKGSLAAMLAAFLQTLSSPFRREAYVVASVDEEYGLCGCRKLAALPIRPHLAITGEPTSLVPIYAQKGIVRSSIVVHGDVDHAAYPGTSNALFGAGQVLAAIRSLNDDMAHEPSGCNLTPATITPTRILSDGDMNKTPAVVRIFFDARIHPDNGSEVLMNRLQDRIHGALDASMRVEIETPYFVSPPNHCNIADPLVQDLFSKIEAVTGRCQPDTFSYGSEAGVLAAIADAALVLGPGDAKYSHGPGERVALGEVAAAARIYAEVLTSS